MHGRPFEGQHLVQFWYLLGFETSVMHSYRYLSRTSSLDLKNCKPWPEELLDLALIRQAEAFNFTGLGF